VRPESIITDSPRTRPGGNAWRKTYNQKNIIDNGGGGWEKWTYRKRSKKKPKGVKKPHSRNCTTRGNSQGNCGGTRNAVGKTGEGFRRTDRHRSYGGEILVKPKKAGADLKNRQLAKAKIRRKRPAGQKNSATRKEKKNSKSHRLGQID